MSVRFDVAKLRRPLGSYPLHSLVLGQLGEFTPRHLHLCLPLLARNLVNATVADLRRHHRHQDHQIIHRTPVHFRPGRQVLINLAIAVAERNRDPEPALQCWIKRSTLSGADIPGFTGSWEGSESVRLSQMTSCPV